MAQARPVTTFLLRNKEKADFNQYWYSQPTITAFAEEVQDQAGATGRSAFLSTPSIFFSLEDETVKKNSVLFDFDAGLSRTAGADRFVQYDFKDPVGTIPAHMLHTFDVVVIDPPFIVEEVWQAYARAAFMLLKTKPDAPADDQLTFHHVEGKILGTTVIERAAFLAELLGVHACAFQPSIPHLVYQYNTYANFESARLDVKNPEIPE